MEINFPPRTRRTGDERERVFDSAAARESPYSGHCPCGRAHTDRLVRMREESSPLLIAWAGACGGGGGFINGG